MTTEEDAHWRGVMEERTNRSTQRLDAMNGDLAEIKTTLNAIQLRLATADAVADSVADKLKERNLLGLTKVQKWAGTGAIVAVCVNLILKVAGIVGVAGL